MERFGELKGDKISAVDFLHLKLKLNSLGTLESQYLRKGSLLKNKKSLTFVTGGVGVTNEKNGGV